MSLSSVRKKGYLYKLPVTGFIKKWSRRWFILYATTIEGVVRIEYYDSEDCEATEIGKRTIPLRDSMGASQTVGNKTHPYVFEITSQIGHHVFTVESLSELDEWVAAIREAINEDRLRMNRKKSQTLSGSMNSERQGQDSGDGGGGGGTGSGGGRPSQSSYYEPATSGTYRVTLEQNETAQRLHLSAAYNLEITPQGILLIAANSGANIAWWEYKHIKTYGRASGTFNIEAGKGAQTGIGTFNFATTCGREIFGVVHRNIKRLKGDKEKERADRGREDAAVLQKKINERQQPALKQRPGGASYHLADKKRHRPTPKKPPPYTSKDLSHGTYRLSKDLDELEAHPPAASERQSSTEPPIYAVVNKPKKKSSSYREDQGPPTHPQPTTASTATVLPSKFHSSNFDSAQLAAATTLPTAAMTTNGAAGRFSYTSFRDSRDSALLEYGNPIAEEDLPPLTSGVENPLENIPDYDMNLVTDIDEFDDQLFETLAEMEVQDEISDLNVVGQKAASVVDRPQIKPVSAPGSRKTERRLSQQEFDKIWDDICATIPDGSELS